jgi:hypothetical protein
MSYEQVTNWFKHKRKILPISKKKKNYKRLSTEKKILLKEFYKYCSHPSKSDVDVIKKKQN